MTDTFILGISALYHDSAAAILKNGSIIAAAQEERFTRIKQDPRFPFNSIDFCLLKAGIKYSDLEAVIFYDKPLLKFERLMETYLSYAPKGALSFAKAVPIWLKEKLWIPETLKKRYHKTGNLKFCEHHESHAASAFFPSPFNEAAFLTIDGVGEWATTAMGFGKSNEIKFHKTIRFPHSLGLLYAAFTYYTGFKVNSGEYKVMGLAPYGNPVFYETIMENIIDLKEDGSFHLCMKYFDYCVGSTMTSPALDELLNAPPRKAESVLTQRDMDLAASIQKVTETVVLKIAKNLYEKTGYKNICMAGGVALNCVANSKIIGHTPFENIWIQPASGDAGGALGAALFHWHQTLGHPRKIQTNISNKTPLNTNQTNIHNSNDSLKSNSSSECHSSEGHCSEDHSSEGHSSNNLKDFQFGSLLGPEWSDAAIRSFLIKNRLTYTEFNSVEIEKKIAKLIEASNVIGHFNGPMEFGPRALGNRSILGDPRDTEMQKTMNLKIKYRESFRPFAPSVLAEKCSEWFDFQGNSPYMLLTAQVNESKKIKIKEKDKALEGLDKLKIPRSLIPAVTHVNGSARLQTVHKYINPRYHAIINEFYKLTGCPVVINTSFNVRGEPIVCSPLDAYRCFMRTEMDYLVLGNYLLSKKEQPQKSDTISWEQKFKLD